MRDAVGACKEVNMPEVGGAITDPRRYEVAERNSFPGTSDLSSAIVISLIPLHWGHVNDRGKIALPSTESRCFVTILPYEVYFI